MLGQLCKSTAQSEFPGKHKSPEFSSSTECVCTLRGLLWEVKWPFWGRRASICLALGASAQ